MIIAHPKSIHQQGGSRCEKPAPVFPRFQVHNQVHTLFDFLSEFPLFGLIFSSGCVNLKLKNAEISGFFEIESPDARQRISVATDQKVRGSNPLRRAKKSGVLLGCRFFVFAEVGIRSLCPFG